MRSVRAGGDPAHTDFRLVEVRERALPRTRRTHRIRVHLAEAGMPILRDDLYGTEPAPRLMLHASELRLAHPADGRELTIRSPVAW